MFFSILSYQIISIKYLLHNIKGDAKKNPLASPFIYLLTAIGLSVAALRISLIRILIVSLAVVLVISLIAVLVGRLIILIFHLYHLTSIYILFF